MEKTELIRCQQEGSVAYITLCRSDKSNALNHEMRIALIECLDHLSGSASVIVLQSSSKHFCAGLDLEEDIEGVEPGDEMWALARTIYDLPAVVIAKVNGAARGGGVSLVDACDLSVAAEGASFGMPEIAYGIYPAIAGALTQLTIPKKHAGWMILTGESVPAEQALAMGLVNLVVPEDQLDQRCVALVEKLASYDAQGLANAKSRLNDVPVNAECRDKAVRAGLDSNAELIKTFKARR